MSKKILNVDTRKWSKEDEDKIIPLLCEYKYQITYIQSDGRKRYAYTNEEPELTELYLKSIGAKILKVAEVGI